MQMTFTEEYMYVFEIALGANPNKTTSVCLPTCPTVKATKKYTLQFNINCVCCLHQITLLQQWWTAVDLEVLDNEEPPIPLHFLLSERKVNMQSDCRK